MTSGIPPFSVDVVRRSDALIVTPRGELDVSTADRVRSAMAQRSAEETLVLDLRELSFVDTSGLQLAVEAHRSAREAGWELVVVRGPRHVQRVFEIAGLDAVLPFADDAPEDASAPTD